MSIGEDFAASLAKADVQKARAARVQYLGGLTLAGLEREEEKERQRGNLDEPTQNLYRAIKAQRAEQDVASLKALEQPEAILTQYVRGLRDGLYSERFQPVVEQIWTDSYRTLAQRSAGEKAVGLAKGFAEGLAEAVPAIARGVGAAGAVATDLTPEAVATAAAAAELGGAQSMRLLRGIPRLAAEDVTKEGLAKIFQRDLKELSDIEGVRRYEGKFLNDMVAKAPGLRSAVENIRATLTPEDLATVDDLSNIFDPTELMPIGFVVTKVGKAFGVAARSAQKSHVMARTFKTAAEAAAEAERLSGTFNKVRKSVGEALQQTGQRVASTPGGAPVSTFLGGLATGMEPSTAFVAAAVMSNIPRSVRRVAGAAVETAGRVIAKDLPVPLERARQGLVEAGRQAVESGAEGLAGNAIFALGAETPEQAGGLLGVGAGLGGAMGAAQPGAQAVSGLFDITRNRFNPAEVTPEAERKKTSSYNEGMDDIHAAAVGKLDNASANAIEDMRNTLVGPEGRLYVVDTPEQAAKIASFYTGQTVTPDMVESNGFSYLPEQTKQGVGVAVVFSKGEAFAHEPGHLIFKAMEVSSDPKIQALAADAKRIANRVLPKNSARFNQLRDYYNSLLPEGAKPIDGERVLEEFIVEHFTTAVGGAPVIKFGGDMPLSKKIYDIALTLGEKVGAYQAGIDFSGRSPVSSKALPIKPSPQLAKIVENMLAARQLDLSKSVPNDLVNSVPGVPPVITPEGVQNVEVVTPPAPVSGFKKGDPIGNITNPQGELVFSGAKVWADSQGPTVRIEGVDASGNIVRADVPRAWLESKAGTAVPPVDVGATVPVPATLTEQPAVPAPGSISGIPPKAPAAPKPTVAKVTEQKRQTVAGVATPELQAQNEGVLAQNLNKPVEVDYLSAVAGEESGDAAVRLRERQLADRNEQEGVPNPFRTIYGKVVVPTSIFEAANGKRMIYGFSPDKLIRNIDQLRGWYLERGDKAKADYLYSPEFQKQVRNYLENQSNGYRGDGEKIIRPEDTDPARYPAENPNYTPIAVAPETRNLINFLMGLDPVSPVSVVGAWVVKLAELNGFKPASYEAGKRAPKPYFNPLVQQLRAAGFDGKLNSAIEQLRIERMVGPAVPRPDLASVKPAVQGSVQAGFMPAAAKPEGRQELVNVGLKIGDKISLTKEDVIKAFADEGITLENVQVRESGTEPTVIAAVRGADKAAIDRVSNTLQQDAIAVYNPANDSGYLAGPRPENFGGKFLKEFFLLPEKEPAFMPAPPVESEAFKRWFGDSKVVDADGKPLVVYHGTDSPEDFSVFATQTSDAGSHFGTARQANARLGSSPRALKETAREGGPFEYQSNGRVYPVFLSLKNPLRVRDTFDAGITAAQDTLWAMREAGALSGNQYTTALKQTRGPEITPRDAWKVVRDTAEAAGYDGFAYENLFEDRNSGALSYVAFRPEQIKSAIGNTGTFDPNNPDIRYMPKAKPLKGSLGKGDVKFFHYSDMPNKGVIDPKFFGKSGVTGAREQAGLPRAYAYAEGSTLGQDAGLIDARKHYYEGTAPKGKIYDGVEDVLGYGDMANRAKADQMLIDKGFVGIYREGLNGVKQLEFFQPMNVTEAEKPATTGPLAEEATPILPPLALEEIDYAAQDREFARKKAAGEPLYMPAPPVESDAFKRWFGDWQDPKAFTSRAKGPVSMAVDANGKPLKLFHSTYNDFNTFEIGRPSKNSWAFGEWDVNRHAAFFTPDEAFSKEYASDRGRPARTMEVYLSMKSPVDMRRWGPGELYALGEEIGINPKWMTGGGEIWELFDGPDGKAFVDALKEKGYDGAIFREQDAAGEYHDTYAVLDPAQVKSAAGNVGTFDPTNPDIRYMPKATEAQETAFKDSKVRNEDGSLKPMFHFTTADFNRFGRGDLGYHFGTAEQAFDRGVANEALRVWGDTETPSAREGSRTIPVYLDIKNPLRMMDVGTWHDPVEVFDNIPSWLLKKEAMRSAHAESGKYQSWMNDWTGPIEKFNDAARVASKPFMDAIREGIKALGYDGIIYRNAFESREQDGDSYIAFDNDQIMPAFTKDVGARWMPEIDGAKTQPLDADVAAAFMPAPRVNLEDYIGRDVVTLTTDRLDVGFKDVGPTGAKKPTRKQAQGGRGFPLLYTGLGWAFSDPGSAKRFLTRLQATADGDTALVATAVLGEHNVLNSPFGQHAVAMAYRHAVDSGVLKLKDVDRSIRTIFSRAAASTLGDPDMKKIKTLEDYERASENWPFSFGATRELAKRLDAAELKIPAELRQAVGLDALSLARSISDPELAGLPNFTLVSLMEIPVDQTPVKDDIHFSYPYTVKGKLLGFLKDPIAADKLISSPRVRKGGQLTAQPMMTVMPSLDLLKPTELNPEPQQVLAEARLEYAKP